VTVDAYRTIAHNHAGLLSLSNSSQWAYVRVTILKLHVNGGTEDARANEDFTTTAYGPTDFFTAPSDNDRISQSDVVFLDKTGASVGNDLTLAYRGGVWAVYRWGGDIAHDVDPDGVDVTPLALSDIRALYAANVSTVANRYYRMVITVADSLTSTSATSAGSHWTLGGLTATVPTTPDGVIAVAAPIGHITSVVTGEVGYNTRLMTWNAGRITSGAVALAASTSSFPDGLVPTLTLSAPTDVPTGYTLNEPTLVFSLQVKETGDTAWKVLYTNLNSVIHVTGATDAMPPGTSVGLLNRPLTLAELQDNVLDVKPLPERALTVSVAASMTPWVTSDPRLTYRLGIQRAAALLLDNTACLVFSNLLTPGRDRDKADAQYVEYLNEAGYPARTTRTDHPTSLTFLNVLGENLVVGLDHQEGTDAAVTAAAPRYYGRFAPAV